MMEASSVSTRSCVFHNFHVQDTAWSSMSDGEHRKRRRVCKTKLSSCRSNMGCHPYQVPLLFPDRGHRFAAAVGSQRRSGVLYLSHRLIGTVHENFGGSPVARLPYFPTTARAGRGRPPHVALECALICAFLDLCTFLQRLQASHSCPANYPRISASPTIATATSTATILIPVSARLGLG